MEYTITITVDDSDITSESIKKAVNYISETLDRMHIAHSIECHKDRMKLMKLTK